MSDPLSGLSAITRVRLPWHRANQVFTATYTITQSDMDAGQGGQHGYSDRQILTMWK
uniref:hypothetical protein n=1 Tax=Algoriphagus halophilus TaxID=226505 RepID=UPI0040382CA1